MNNYKRKAIVALMTISVLMWVCLQFQPSSIFADTTYQYTRTYISGDGDITSQFHVAGMTGLCQDGHKASASSGKARLSRLSGNAVRTKLAYYYGYKNKWISGTKGCRLARCFFYCVSGEYYHQSKTVISKMISVAEKVTVPDWFEAYVGSPVDSLQSFVAWRYEEPALLYLEKRSTVTDSEKTGKYSFLGIKYGVFSDKSCKNRVGVLTCKSTGKTQTIKLKEGTYYLKEITAAGGYQKSETVYTAKLTSGKKKVVDTRDKPKTGKILIRKEFSEDSDEGYTLKGFKFVLTNIKDEHIVYSGNTDGEGKLSIDGILAGDYRISEKMTAKQLEENENLTQEGKVQIEVEKEKKCVWKNRYMKKHHLKIVKTMGDGRAAGGFSFEVTGTETEKKEVKTTEKTADNDVIILDKLRKGTYTVEEKLTEMQKLQYYQPKPITKSVEKDDNDDNLVFMFENKPKWTPVKVKKVCSDGQIEGVEFRVTGKTAFGEDVDIKALTDSDGIADFGHLYCGNYILEETGFDSEKYLNTYKVAGHPGKQCLEFEVTGTEGKTLWLGSNPDISRDSSSAVNYDGEAEHKVFINKLRTRLLFSKLDSETKQFLPGAKFRISNSKGDSVAVFETTEKYDEEGNPIAGAEIISSDFEISILGYDELSAEDQQETLNEEKQNGLAIDRSNFFVLKGLEEGEKYVIEEIVAPDGYFAGNTGTTVKISDLDSVVFENKKPEICTFAADYKTGSKTITADSSVEIVDVVEFKRLIPGRKYRLIGMIMNRQGVSEQNAEDMEVMECNGKAVMKEIEFVPEKSDGTVEVVFKFDGAEINNCQGVVYEKLFDGDLMVASHMEYDSDAQTVSFESPEISGIDRVVAGKSEDNTGSAEKKKSDVSAGDDFPWGLLLIAIIAMVCTAAAIVLYKKSRVGE